MNTSNCLDSDQEFLVYTEVTENPPEPTDEEIEEYARRIGINLETEPHLLFLAREGINHTLPEPWKPCLNKSRDVVFYLNEETQQTQWEHPMDSVYRDRVVQARAELALNRIQNFDPLTKRPPNKDLPPIKRSGGGLAPINAVSGSLGKLGSFGIPPSINSELRQRTPSRPLNNDLSNNFFNSNNNKPPLGRIPSTESNIISGSSLNSFKDSDDEEESTPSLVRPQPLKKLGGLTITGGGANFLKGTKSADATATTTEGSRLGTLSNGRRDFDESNDVEDEAGGSGDMEKSEGGGTNFLRGTMSVDATATAKGNRLGSFSHVESMNEVEAGGSGDSEKKPIKSILVNSISRSRPKIPTDNIYELDGFSMNLDGMTDDEKQVLSQLDSNSSATSKAKGNVKFNLDENTELKFEMNELQFIPEYSDADITAMKKAMQDEMENELKKFKDQLEEERKSRQEQIQKHLEETVAQFKLEKDETIRRIRKDMDNEKLLEIERAKREIEVLLQKEIDEMKTNFDETLQRRRRELEEEHLKRIDDLTREYRKKEEDKVSEILTRKSSQENLKQLEEDLQKQQESLREEHEKQILQIKDYHKSVLDRVKADLEVEEEKVRQDHTRRRAEMIAKFEQETEELKKKLIKSQEDALKKIKDEFEVSKAALEKSLKNSLQEVKDRISTQHKSASETNLHDKAADEELNALKLKYQQLESKYKAMRMELQQITQEMSPAKNRNDSAISVSLSCKSKGKSKNEQSNPVSARTERTRPSSKKSLNKSLSARNESLEVTATDSAHCSESNTDTNSSHYPTSDGMRLKLKSNTKGGNSPDEEDSTSETNRINSALQALEILKKEILELKHGKEKKHHNNSSLHQDLLESEGNALQAQILNNNNKKVSTPKKSTSVSEGPHSARKNKSSGNTTSSKPKSSKSARSKELSRPQSDPAFEDPHQRIVEDAKAFIRMQKNRLKDPSPIPNSTHLILPTAKNNLLLFDEKLLKSASPRRPTSIHLDLMSETESSGVSSLKDHRSSERNSATRICASLPSSARRPLVPPTSPTTTANNTNLGATAASLDFTNSDLAMSLSSGPRYSSLLSNNQSSSSQTVLDALRMSGLSTTRLDCTDLLKSLEDELKEFKTTKQKLLEKGPTKGTSSSDKRNSLIKQNNQTSNILEKTKDLEEWLKKY